MGQLVHVGRRGSAGIIKDKFVLAYLVLFQKYFSLTNKLHMDEEFCCAVDGLYHGVHISSLCSTLHLIEVC